MTIKARKQVKQVVGAGVCELEAKTGESLLIKCIRVYNGVGNYVTVSIDKTTVGYFRVGGALGNHLEFPKVDLRSEMTIVNWLIDQGYMEGYPVEEGETFKVTGHEQAGAVVHIHYDVYDAGDMVASMPNGSKSEEYTYLSYGNSGAAITTAGEHLLDTVVNPSEFPGFPFGADVPARYEIALNGILATEHGVGAAGPTDTLGTMYLKLIRDRTVMADDDKNGYIMYRDASALIAQAVGGGQSEIHGFTEIDSRHPFVFPEPIIFQPGEELNAYLTYGFAAGAPSVSLELQEVAFILTARRVA